MPCSRTDKKPNFWDTLKLHKFCILFQDGAVMEVPASNSVSNFMTECTNATAGTVLSWGLMDIVVQVGFLNS